MAHPLFVYGTLHPDRAPAVIAASVRLLRSLGRATIRARLYDLGQYPGVVLTSDGETVFGELFEVPDDAEVLARLDDYEDFRPGDPATSLFLRQVTEATLADGTRRACWVYTYNGI